MIKKTENSFVEAAKLSCQSKIREAEAKIDLYVNSSQGIADHAGIMDEILSAAESGAHAQDILKFLEKKW